MQAGEKGKKQEKSETVGQQALEYLMTYGWTLILISAIVGLLIFIATPPQECQPFHSFSNNFLIENFEITGSDSSLLPNKFVIILKPKMTVTLQSYKLLSGSNECTENVIGESVRFGKLERIIISGEIKAECQDIIKECYQFTDEIKYTDYFGMARTETGRFTGRFTNVSQSYEATAWERSEFPTGILDNEPSKLIGSFDEKCPAEPPEEGTVNFVTAAAYETWSLPAGCNTGCTNGGCTGQGFAVAYCLKNAQYLAHGWYRAQLWMSPLFAGRKLYLVGNGSYEDPVTHEAETNGICINDNFYFYVNGNLLTRGGTTGIEGSEVIRHCDGCSESDYWCIPAVELTASSEFKFGEWNDIYVLVEDYCNGGGLKAFNFFMV
ncbi:MAG: hypothetical protein JW744_03995 [Candidatus Diapherotrites archaeon]|uniref:Uncharacterized protein n=1 Tax=Candidatus Iainarchaeum sp. TaxID=3101447 RepID=A0A938YT43_9ARCH|nr:hypothetical protein [Candidatus Diapherotrites archaeon]